MPEKETLKRARKARREGKAATTQAGEFVREEVHHVREGKHGTRSPKQAIAIGLSKARRAGVKLPAPKRASERVKRQAARDSPRGEHADRPSRRRAKASAGASKREPHRTASRPALRSQAHRAAQRRSPAERSASARKASRTGKNVERGRKWSQEVTEHSDAMTLEPRAFTQRDPRAVAASVKRSADKSDRLKSSPFRSAMSMLNFYINRAGKNLSARKRDTLERAKERLRELFDRKEE